MNEHSGSDSASADQSPSLPSPATSRPKNHPFPSYLSLSHLLLLELICLSATFTVQTLPSLHLQTIEVGEVEVDTVCLR